MNDINELSKISIEEYLNNDEMCIAVTKKKYLEYPEQPIAEFYGKVIDNILEYSGDIDKEFKDRIFEDWFRGIWKGAGSILSAASLVDRNVSVFNCTGIVIQGDTLDDIADARKWVSKMAAHRQGIGILFDKIRPRGMKVNNSALVSEGAVHWMKSFDNIGYEVGQLSRQCALLIALSVNHPDVKEFITCKDDVNNIQNANISVQVTDEFMKNVRDNKLHHMSFTTERGETYTVEIPAIELFKLICNQAWKNGEPGLQFIDKMKSWSIIEALGYSIEITNACNPSNSTVLTPNGISTIGKITIGDTIWSGKEWVTVIKKWKTGTKDTYRYITNAGEFLGTSDHNILCNGKKVEVGLSKGIDISIGPESGKTSIIPQDVLDGLVLGDGTVVDKTGVCLCIGENDFDYFESEVKDLIHDKIHRSTDCKYKVTTTLTPDEVPKTYERTVPDRFFYGNSDKVASFLRGLFSANGNVLVGKGTKRIILKQSSFNLIKQVQKMLSSLGIPSYITYTKAKSIEFSNGVCDSEKSYDINITKGADVFLEKIGFIQKYKQDILIEICNTKRNINRFKKTHDIIDCIYLGVQDVFEITVDHPDHVYWSDGSLVSNCSEVPMTDQSVCCLAPLNMEFVPDPFKSSNDFHKFMEDKVKDMVRFMDDVVQYELNLPYKSPTIKQREVVSDLREIGLGILNLHKWFYGIGIAYDSEEAVKYTNEFFKWYLYYAFKASAKLAEERGACGAWMKLKNENKLEEYETPFLKNFFNEFPEMREVYHQTGIRNGSLVSIAPTGCGVVSNEILTDSDVVSIKDILIMNNINFEEIEKDPFQEGKWFDFINPIKVKVKEGVYQDVNKIYYNGKKFTRTIIFEDGTECTFTGEHPLKVSMDGKEFWIQTKDLKEGMEVIQY